MTLTNRLSLFFLGTLALVLAGFSAALFGLAWVHLHRQADERLDGALNTLVAAAEVSPEGVEWEPAERPFAFDPGAFAGPVLWLVTNNKGRVLDRTGQVDCEEFFDEAGQSLGTDVRGNGHFSWNGDEWQVRRRWVRGAHVSGAEGGHTPPPGNVTRYPALSITAAVPLAPVHAQLRHLGAVLAGVSLLIWVVALFVGRAVCRRALRPVTRMATAVRDMNASDLGQRLPTAATGDELEELSHAFNAMLSRLQESFERQGRFTGDASHQLRTPLTAILGQIEVALRRDRPAEEYQRVLKTVHEQAEQLRRIVEALLFLARADADAHVPDRESFPLGEWLDCHLHSWAQHSRAGDFKVDRGADSPFVEVQPLLLGELLNILLENACKFSPPGTPVTIHLGRDGQDVVLSVEDQGCGITAEDLPRVCEPFFRSSDARRRGFAGLGLGLAIAKRLAEAIGGRLVLTSTLGQGSAFAVRIPVRQDAVADLPTRIEV